MARSGITRVSASRSRGACGQRRYGDRGPVLGPPPVRLARDSWGGRQRTHICPVRDFPPLFSDLGANPVLCAPKPQLQGTGFIKSPALQGTRAGTGTKVSRTWTHTPRGRKIGAGPSGEGPPAARTSPRGHPPPRARQAFVLGAPTPPAPELSKGTKQPAPPTPSPGPGPGPSDFLGIAATLGTRGVRR